MTADEQMAGGIEYIRLRAGEKGGKGNVESGWGEGGSFVYDPARARTWAKKGNNLAILTGHRSGSFCADIDPKNGGTATMAAAEAEFGALSRENVVSTPSGGEHRIFSTANLDFPVGNDTNGVVIGPGVDIKGEWGYRLAPGSSTASGVYTQVRGEVSGPYPDPPEWLVERLREHAARRHQRRSEPLAEVEKVEHPDPCCVALADETVARVLDAVDTVAALKSGDRHDASDALGQPGVDLGWDGLYLAAARLVEIARWPHSTYSVEQAREDFLEHAPGAEGSYDPVWKFHNGHTQAGTWGDGERHRYDTHGGPKPDWLDEKYPVTVLTGADGNPLRSEAAAQRELRRLSDDKQPDDPDQQHQRNVLAVMGRLREHRDAQRMLAAEERGQQPIPRPVSLASLLAEPDEERVYRIEGLWPAGGRVVLAAPMKSGKTTLTGNLIRSLVDGQPFLGHFATEQATKVVLIDDEMDREQIKRWLRSQGIEHTDRVEVISLRGQVATFDVLDASRRAEWVELIRGADVVVLDCLRPILDALGLSEDKEAGRFLVAFDALLKEAGVREALLVHHTGHAGERSRGDSRLRDWPDAEWKITRQTEDDSKPRFFRAFGRDVDVDEGRLDYDAASRRLAYIEGEDRRNTVDEKLVKETLEFVRDNPKAISNEITAHLGCNKSAAKACLDRCRRDYLLVDLGPKNSKLHTLSPAGDAWLSDHVLGGKLVTSA